MTDTELLAALEARITREGNKPFPPATSEQLRASELVLGFALPPVLRLVYSQVGNGGFGPGYKLMGVEGGMPDDLGETAVSSYLSRRQPDPDDPSWSWPERWLPVLHWGCCVTSCVDCSDPEAPVLRFDPSPKEDGGEWAECFGAEEYTLREWLLAWARGKDLW